MKLEDFLEMTDVEFWEWMDRFLYPLENTEKEEKDENPPIELVGWQAALKSYYKANFI